MNHGRGVATMSVRLETLAHESTTLPDAVIDELRATFHGTVLTPEGSGYEQACVVQNGMIHRRPGLIMRCSGTADVVDAVNLARENDLLIAVQGGGHSIAGHSICDDGLQIDLSGMRGVWANPVTRTVRVQGGATWGDVDRETQLYGLAVPGGIVSTTGVPGLTLGGGIGWLHRKYGLACDNLRGAEIVTADGQVLRVSDSELPELLWGLRGGGGNFGVVTAFEFEAHPVGPLVFTGLVMYSMDDAEEVLSSWRDWAAGLPDEVTARATLWGTPEDPHLPPEVHNKDVVIASAVYTGPVEEGEAVISPTRSFATPLADLSGPMPYRTVQSLLDPFFVRGQMNSYWKSVYLGELDDDAVELVVRRGRERPHPLTMLHIPLLGGAMGRVDPSATAFGDRSPALMLSVDGNWTDPADTAGNVEWVRETMAEANRLPSASGTYLNFSGDDAIDATQRQEAFGANLRRLNRLKAQYDPRNRFRMNNNIPPRAAEQDEATAPTEHVMPG